MKDSEIIFENLKYRVQDKKAYLVGRDSYLKGNQAIIIPNSLIVNNDEIPVVGIDENVITDWDVISLIIPDSVLEIGENNFNYLRNLQSLVISNNVTRLKDCFRLCDSLRSIACNENLTLEGDVCLNDGTPWVKSQPFGSICLGATLICYKPRQDEIVKHYVVPANVSHITQWAFDDFNYLESIDFNNAQIVESELPDSVMTVTASGDSLQKVGLSKDSLANTSWYKNQPDGCVYIGNLLFRYKSENNEIPTKIQLRERTRGINAYAFYKIGEERFEVICNDELTVIGGHAFEESKLSKIFAPCLKEIQECAFCNSMLYSIEFLYSLRKIGMEAFYHCKLGPTISIPSSIEEISDRAFARNIGIVDVYIENYGAKIIGDGAFGGCNIKSIFIPESVKKIGAGAFFDNNCLCNIYLSEGVEIIGDRAFSTSESYGNLHLLEIPSTVKKIGEDAFRRYNYHEEDFYAEGGRVIEHYPTYTSEADEIDTLVIAANLDVFWSLLVGKKLETVILKEGITTIPKYGFNKCMRLRNVIIPSTLQTIGEFAFRECESLDTLILPSIIEELWSSSLPPNIKKVVLQSRKLKLKIGIHGKEKLNYYINNRVFVDPDGETIEPEVVIFDLGDENEEGQYYCEGRCFDIKIVDDFEEFVVEDPELDNVEDDEHIRPSYSQYGGYNGFDDDTINSAFEGDPEATWNVD